MKKLLYTSMVAFLLSATATNIFAQSVGIGTTTPNASARLEINATNKGLLIPQVALASLTDGATIPAPANSLLIYNTNSAVGTGFYFNSGTPASPNWTKLATGTGGAASGWAITGNAGTDTAINFIGTTSNMPVRFRVNNIKSGQISLSNVFIGDSAGVKTKESQSFYNVAVGRKAFLNNDSGAYNVAIGAYALRYSSKDSESVAVGPFALYSSDDYYGGGNLNTAVGSNALSNSVDGAYNTGIGAYSLIDVTSGVGNTGLGNFTDCYDTTNSVDVNNATAIGFGAIADGDNMVKIGDDNVVQIGGAVDWSVVSDRRYKKDIKTDNGGLNFIMQLRPVNYHYNYTMMNNARVKLLSNRLIHAKDPILKANIYNALNRLKSTSYQARVAKSQSNLYNGLIAQDVEEAALKSGYNFSGVVKPTKPNGRYALRYATFVVPLINAVQEQQKIIESQNKKIDDLIKRLEKLEQK